MPGNSAFELVTEKGWRRGLNNLLDNEFSRWWKTSRWWKQSIIWMAVIGFMVGEVLFISKGNNLEGAFMIYAMFAGMFPAIAVIIFMQGVLVGEKKSGTAAWILSKPASRTAFIFSKLIANSLSALVTMVILPGLVAFLLFFIRTGVMISPIQFLLALGVIFLNLLFYLTLTLMLGAFFNNRSPVIGIPLALLFLQQYLIGLVPFMRYILPWTLVIPLDDGTGSVVNSLLTGLPASSLIPVVFVFLECILFVVLGLWRFSQEEF
jgi:ABC-2 type transport system permease protein